MPTKDAQRESEREHCEVRANAIEGLFGRSMVCHSFLVSNRPNVGLSGCRCFLSYMNCGLQYGLELFPQARSKRIGRWTSVIGLSKRVHRLERKYANRYRKGFPSNRTPKYSLTGNGLI